MDIVQEAKKFVLQEIEKYGILRKAHVEFVEMKSKELANELGADTTTTLVGAYLMDIKLGQAAKEKRREEHVRMGVEATKEFLGKFAIDSKTKDNIVNCVEAHHAEIPYICKEAEIVANADCYPFIHPKGFFSFLMSLGEKGFKLEEALDLAELKLDEKYKILSLDICKKELEPYYFQLKELIKKVKEF